MNGIHVVSAGNDRAALELAFGMRYRAYRAAGHIDPRASGRFDDSHDESPGAETLLAHLDGQAVGTIRILRKASHEGFDALLATKAFAGELAAALPADAHAVEINRFALEPAHQTPGSFRVKLAMLKTVLASCLVDGVRYCVAAVRDEHLRFYTHFLHMQRRSEPLDYPGLRCPTSLLVGDLSAGQARIGQSMPALLPNAETLVQWRQHRRVEVML